MYIIHGTCKGVLSRGRCSRPLPTATRSAASLCCMVHTVLAPSFASMSWQWISALGGLAAALVAHTCKRTRIQPQRELVHGGHGGGAWLRRCSRARSSRRSRRASCSAAAAPSADGGGEDTNQATCDDGLGLGSALPPPAGCPAGIPPASVVSAPRHPRVPSTAPPSLLRPPFIPSVAAAPVRGGRRRPAAAGHDAAGRRWRGPTRLKN